jgi:DNA invertase Pin-like site-specific DNA recombinase
MPDLKVTADHLQRDAYLYVRQSTLRQVAENGESTQRQYALRDRAIAAGWPPERIHVIDCDLGKSGANAIARDGFQELVSEVALAKAGVVMGLEVSRLARNSADWHRLLELCALAATLILDEDGVYDPASFNDRLLLGLKGTMSEAELHILRARMRGGQLNRARRGELEISSGGLIYRPRPRRRGTRGALVFDIFERTGSTIRTGRFFLDQGILSPRRLRKEPNRGELLWAPPAMSAFCKFCTIRDMPAPSSMAEHARATHLGQRLPDQSADGRLAVRDARPDTADTSRTGSASRQLSSVTHVEYGGRRAETTLS